MQDRATLIEPGSAAIHDGLPADRRRWAMTALCSSVAISSLSTAIANIALPAIAEHFAVDPATAVWVVNTYQIAMVALLMPLAALGEIISYRRIYHVGIVLFTLGSLASALAWSFPALLAGRTLQGIGAAGLMSVNSALVAFIYPRRLLGRGLGLTSMTVATFITVGPTVGSTLLLFGDWRLLFAINVPFGIVAAIIAFTTLPTSPKAPHPFDLTGAVFLAAATGLLIVAVGSAAHSASAAEIALELVIAMVLGWLLIRRQADHPAPMLPVDLFKYPIFALSAATAVCSFATQGLAFVSLPFYFENVQHLTPVATGFLLTPWPLVVGIMAPIAGRLADRHPAGLLGGIGLVVLAIGMALLALLPENPSIPNIVWRTMVSGCGFGFFQTPNMRAIMSSGPAHRRGGASGIAASARLTGQALGAALAALCFGLAGQHGPILALTLGIFTAALGSVMSFLRLAAR
jgi:DHA2 family multidrug resistance protein-like MFS transporter